MFCGFRNGVKLNVRMFRNFWKTCPVGIVRMLENWLLLISFLICRELHRCYPSSGWLVLTRQAWTRGQHLFSNRRSILLRGCRWCVWFIFLHFVVKTFITKGISPVKNSTGVFVRIRWSSASVSGHILLFSFAGNLRPASILFLTFLSLCVITDCLCWCYRT